MTTPNRSWVVRVRATVTKDVYVEGCTENAAWEEPFEHASNETEVDQESFEVLSVQPLEN